MHKVHMLKILAGAPAHGMFGFAVRREMNATSGHRVGDNEFAELVTDLTRAGFLTATPDALFGDARLAITETGRAAIDGL